jgi:hypothetical protein
LHWLYGTRIVRKRLWVPTGSPINIISYAHLLAIGDKRFTVNAACSINLVAYFQLLANSWTSQLIVGRKTGGKDFSLTNPTYLKGEKPLP